jgi:hypothetical protein
MTLAALLAALHILVGPSVGAAAIETLTLRFADATGLPWEPNPTPSRLAATAPDARGPRDRPAKWRHNLLLVLIHLFLFQTAATPLIAQIAAILTTRFAEADVELLLLLFRHSGFAMRSDDPAALRDVLKALHARLKRAGIRGTGGEEAEGEGEGDEAAAAGGKAAAAAAKGAAAPVPPPPASTGRRAMVLGAEGSAAPSVAALAAKFGAKLPTGGGGGGGGGAGAMPAASASPTPSSPSALVDGEGEPLSLRMRFLGDMLLDLRNNRKRAEIEALTERSGGLRKWLSRLAAKQSGLEGVDRRLRVGWPDLFAIPEMGRWWLVGASWVGRAAAGASSRAAEPIRLKGGSLIAAAPSGAGGAKGAAGARASSGAASEDGIFGAGAGTAGGPAAAGASAAADATVAAFPPGGGSGGGGGAGDALGGAHGGGEAELLALATAMRMNTATRRSVFTALMGAEDVDTALDRLLRLNLRGPSEREIIRVLLDCAAQEAAFNPFYAAVGARLATLHPRFKFTIQLAFWDAFKSFAEEGKGGGGEGGEGGASGVATPRRV